MTSYKSRAEVLDKIYRKKRLIRNFDFDALTHPPINNYLGPYEHKYLYKYATSAKYSAKAKKRMEAIDEVMRSKNFTRFASGTNRVIYKSEYDASFLLKVGLDEIGISDNFGELFNQHAIKPFVSKTFDVKNTVGMAERFEIIDNREKFKSFALDIYEILNSKIFGKYIMEDVGSDFFMNWGLRKNFGPGLVDYPYCYTIKYQDLLCKNRDSYGHICGGLVDYDYGFNTIICTKCGKRYTARSLGTELKLVSYREEIEREVDTMSDFIVRSVIDGKLYDSNEKQEDKTIRPPKHQYQRYDRNAPTPQRDFYVAGVIRLENDFDKTRVVEVFNNGKKIVLTKKDNSNIAIEKDIPRRKKEQDIKHKSSDEALEKSMASEMADEMIKEQHIQKANDEFNHFQDNVQNSTVEETWNEVNKIHESIGPQITRTEENPEPVKKEAPVINNDTIDKLSIQERLDISSFLAEKCNEFDFSKYGNGTSEEYKRDVLEYLKDALCSKFNVDNETAEVIAKEHADAYYLFGDESEDQSSNDDDNSSNHTEDTDKYEELAELYQMDPKPKRNKTRMKEF